MQNSCPVGGCPTISKRKLLKVALTCSKLLLRPLLCYRLLRLSIAHYFLFKSFGKENNIEHKQKTLDNAFNCYEKIKERHDKRNSLSTTWATVLSILIGMEKDEQKLWAERVVKAVNCAFPEVIVTPVIVATKKHHCTSFGSCII